MKALEIAGFGIGLGLVGEVFESEGLKQAGISAVKFISPAINISVGGSLIKQLKNFGNNL